MPCFTANPPLQIAVPFGQTSGRGSAGVPSVLLLTLVRGGRSDEYL